MFFVSNSPKTPVCQVENSFFGVFELGSAFAYLSTASVSPQPGSLAAFSNAQPSLNPA
jgi:hypothetical protein